MLLLLLLSFGLSLLLLSLSISCTPCTPCTSRTPVHTGSLHDKNNGWKIFKDFSTQKILIISNSHKWLILEFNLISFNINSLIYELKSFKKFEDLSYWWFISNPFIFIPFPKSADFSYPRNTDLIFSLAHVCMYYMCINVMTVVFKNSELNFI
jgi:hypothetical protein